MAGPQGYLDAASTLPLHPAAREAMLAVLDSAWADPARRYSSARQAGVLLHQAREQAAALIGARPDEVFFPASGTAAVHAGVAGALAGRRRQGRQLVVSAVEHSCVLAAADQHAREGGAVDLVGVDHWGRVDLEQLSHHLSNQTALLCLQSANHEVGTRQPVGEAAQAAGALGVPLLVDAAQSLGWAQPAPGWSVLTASAHKWGGPPGVGVLAVRTGTRWRGPWPADERGWGRAPGFENLPAIIAAVVALEQARASADEDSVRLSALIDRIRHSVPCLVGDVEVVGDPSDRLPGTVTFCCLYADGESLLTELDRAGLAVSSGSSCTSSTREPSHVLVAMGVLTSGSIRVSLPRTVTDDDVERLLAALPGAVTRVRAALGADDL